MINCAPEKDSNARFAHSRAPSFRIGSLIFKVAADIGTGPYRAGSAL